MKISEIEVKFIDWMGSDISVVNAARVSFHKESKMEEYAIEGDEYSLRVSEKDVKLINYLAKHNHWTPFAHAFASFRIKAPIFVARQLVKHQVGLAWNEVSRRYVDEEPEFWFPKEWRGKPVNAKQGSSDTVVTSLGLLGFQEWLPEDAAHKIAAHCMDVYNAMITAGVAPEQARMVLPLNTMTEWIWSGSLAAFVRVCKLRLDPHAQLECQMVAQQIREQIEPVFPVSFKALLEN